MASYLYGVGAMVANTTVSAGSITVGEIGYTALGGATAATVGVVAVNILAFTTKVVGTSVLKTVLKICPPDLKKYTLNISDKFKAKSEGGALFQSAYNRHKEVLKVEAMLSTKDNSAVFLHGPSGVGKTAIVEQIVYRQVTGKSKALEGYEILKLEHNKLFSLEKGIWAKVKDEFLSNGSTGELSKIFDALKDGKYILFIDEAYNVINLQFFQNKLEELARGQVKLIFATTTAEMTKCTNDWTAMMKRRIPIVEIKEFDFHEMVAALKEGKEDYESQYGVKLEDDALEAVVALATFEGDETLTHKAVHLLGAMCNAIKTNSKDPVTAKAVINCYAMMYSKNAAELERNVAKMIVTLKPEDIAPYFQKVEPVRTPYSASVVSVFEKARSCFASSLSTCLVEPSKRAQALLIQYFSQDQVIIPINLNDLANIFSQLSPKNQIAFIKYFDTLCTEQRPFFFIQDSDNFYSLFRKSATQKNIPIPAQYQDELERGVNTLNDFLGTYNIRIPKANTLRNLVDETANKNVLLAAFYNSPFIQLFVAKVLKKQVKVIAPLNSSEDISFGDGTPFRLQTMDTLRLDQVYDLLKGAYSDIAHEVISQTLICAAYFWNKQALDWACRVLDAVRDDKCGRPLEVIKQKFIEFKKDLSLVETVMHQHKYLHGKFAVEVKKVNDEATPSPAVDEVLKELAKTKARMNYLPIEKNEREDFIAKMSKQTSLYHFSTKVLDGCTLSKEFQQELILDKLIELNETIGSGLFVFDIPFALQNEKIAAQIEKMVTVHDMKGVYFCSQEEIEVPKAAAPAEGLAGTMLEKVVSLAMGQIIKKEVEKAEPQYNLPEKLCVESRKIIQIDLNDEHYKKASTLFGRIENFFMQSYHAVIGFGQRSFKVITRPFNRNFNFAWVSLSFLQSKK